MKCNVEEYKGRPFDRISTFCNDLAEEWQKYPDYRFGQMMMNIFREMVANGRDPFFVEEEDMLNAIKLHMSKITGKKTWTL